MRCLKAHKLLSPYMDGELHPAKREALESHLKECDGCRAEFESLQKLQALFGHTEKYSAPYGFATRVTAAAGARSKGRAALAPWFVKLAEAALFALIISAGVLSGDFLSGRLMPEKTASLTSSLSLEIFDPAPPESLGGVYLAMMEESHER